MGVGVGVGVVSRKSGVLEQCICELLGRVLLQIVDTFSFLIYYVSVVLGG